MAPNRGSFAEFVYAFASVRKSLGDLHQARHIRPADQDKRDMTVLPSQDRCPRLILRAFRRRGTLVNRVLPEVLRGEALIASERLLENGKGIDPVRVKKMKALAPGDLGDRVE